MKISGTNCRSDNAGRQSARLNGYDYSGNGAYFVTICTEAKAPYFAIYPLLKDVAQTEWESLPDRFPNLITDAFVVMPNHIHTVIILDNAGAGLDVTQENVGATFTVALGERKARPYVHRAGARPAATGMVKAGSNPAPTVGDIVGAYKSLCVNRWLKYIKQEKMNAVGAFWQRNYYERIIRDEEELNRVREYIIANPANWPVDGNNPERVFDADYVKAWQWLEE